MVIQKFFGIDQHPGEIRPDAVAFPRREGPLVFIDFFTFLRRRITAEQKQIKLLHTLIVIQLLVFEEFPGQRGKAAIQRSRIHQIETLRLRNSIVPFLQQPGVTRRPAEIIQNTGGNAAVRNGYGAGFLRQKGERSGSRSYRIVSVADEARASNQISASRRRTGLQANRSAESPADDEA